MASLGSTRAWSLTFAAPDRDLEREGEFLKPPFLFGGVLDLFRDCDLFGDRERGRKATFCGDCDLFADRGRNATFFRDWDFLGDRELKAGFFGDAFLPLDRDLNVDCEPCPGAGRRPGDLDACRFLGGEPFLAGLFPPPFTGDGPRLLSSLRAGDLSLVRANDLSIPCGDPASLRTGDLSCIL